MFGNGDQVYDELALTERSRNPLLTPKRTETSNSLNIIDSFQILNRSEQTSKGYLLFGDSISSALLFQRGFGYDYA